MTAPALPQVWTEKIIVEHLRAAVASVFPDAEMWSGKGGGRWFAPADWQLTGMRQFQYGDFRLETPELVAVVEIDTAGGVTNLVKYWPYLKTRPPALAGRRFRLAHLFALGSTNDYATHLRLWDFLAERMREDLVTLDWEARRFVGRNVAAAVEEVVAFVSSSTRD